jgi:uncharacterized protein
MLSDPTWITRELSHDSPLIVGMLHVPALPGSPRYCGDLNRVVEFVLRDADNWASAGVDRLMLENFGDVPFFANSVPAITIAHMTCIALKISQRLDVSLGINVLRNDAFAALSIAHAVGAQAIRANVLASARVTDQGVVEGQAAELMRLRSQLRAESIAVLADVDVKHSAALARQSLGDQTRDLIDRALADAVIVSGSATGHGVCEGALAEVVEAAQKTPVLIGSGVSQESVNSLRRFASGYIVGTAVKEGGKVDAPVDVERVKKLLGEIRR